MSKKLFLVSLKAFFISISLLFVISASADRSTIQNISDENLKLISSGQRQLMVMSYNVEHLMDAYDDPNTMDDYFTPESSLNWTNEKFLDKAKKIAEAILSVGDQGYYGYGPDVIVLQEVENKKTLQVLMDFLNEKLLLIDPSAQLYSQIVHYDTDDYIGIETGIIARVDVVSSQTHVIHKRNLTWYYKSASEYYGKEIFSTVRDILEARFSLEGKEFIVYANHWPAKKRGGKAFDAVKRFLSAQYLRNLVKERMQVDPRVDIIIAGDFNCGPEEVALSNGLNSTDNISLVKSSTADAPILYNLNYEIFNFNKLSRQFNATFDRFVSVFTKTGKWDGWVFNDLINGMYDKKKARFDIKEYIAKYDGKLVKAALNRFEKELFNNLLQKRGTFWFAKYKTWNTIDSIILNKGLFDRTGLSYVKNSYKIIDSDILKDEEGLPYGYSKCVWDSKKSQCKKDSNGLDIIRKGYSDHFPIVAKFRLYN